MPIAWNYPRNLKAIELRYDRAQACLALLRRIRWGKHFICPKCGHVHDRQRPRQISARSPESGRFLLICRNPRCRYQASVLANTSLDHTYVPLPLWVRAVWWMTENHGRTSVRKLQDYLGLRNYRTTWRMHRLIQRTQEAMPGYVWEQRRHGTLWPAFSQTFRALLTPREDDQAVS